MGRGRTRVSLATERGESAGGGDRTRDARAVSRREPSPRDGSPGTSGTQMPFSDARGDETRPEGCQMRGARSGTGGARGRTSKLELLVGVNLEAVRHRGRRSRAGSLASSLGARDLWRPKHAPRAEKERVVRRRRASFGAQANSHLSMSDSRASGRVRKYRSPCKKRPVSVKKCVVTIRIHKCLAAASSAASPSLFPSETNASPSPPRSELPVPALAPMEPCLSKCLLLARRSIRSRRASLTRPKCGGCGRRRWRPPRGSPRRAACRTATSR